MIYAGLPGSNWISLPWATTLPIFSQCFQERELPFGYCCPGVLRHCGEKQAQKKNQNILPYSSLLCEIGLSAGHQCFSEVLFIRIPINFLHSTAMCQQAIPQYASNKQLICSSIQLKLVRILNLMRRYQHGTNWAGELCFLQRLILELGYLTR